MHPYKSTVSLFLRSPLREHSFFWVFPAFSLAAVVPVTVFSCVREPEMEKGCPFSLPSGIVMIPCPFFPWLFQAPLF